MTRPNALSASAECSSRIVTEKAGWCVPTAVLPSSKFQSPSLRFPTQRRPTSAQPALPSEVYASEVKHASYPFFPASRNSDFGRARVSETVERDPRHIECARNAGAQFEPDPDLRDAVAVGTISLHRRSVAAHAAAGGIAN